MAKLILDDVVNLQNEPTAVGTINANSALIEAALEKTLSRDGTAPNSMQATLDMNSNHIINLPPAGSLLEPLRYQDLLDFTGGEFTNLFQLDVHGEFATKGPVTDTANLVRFYEGSASSRITNNNPTFSVSRYDGRNVTTGTITGTPVYIEMLANQTSTTSGLAPATGLLVSSKQTGVNDVLGIGVEVQNSGGGSRWAYGYYANVWANAIDAAAYGQEIYVFNDSVDTAYATGTTPYHAGAVYFAGGSKYSTAGLYFDRAPTNPNQWDAGIAFRPGSVRSVTIQDDSSSTVIMKTTGNHSTGIDFTSSTFIGNAFQSNGFSVATTGGISTPNILINSTNGKIELGLVGTSNTPYLDFHSSANNIDYDSRIIASGGTGTVGQGTLTIAAATLALPAVTTIGGIQVVSLTDAQTLTNKTLTNPIINGGVTSSGTAAVSWQMDRASSGNGNSFQIKAGSAQSGATDTWGGDLYLDAGSATGSRYSSIFLRTASGGTSGTTDRNPTTALGVWRQSGTYTVLSLGSAGTPWLTFDDTSKNLWQDLPSGSSYSFGVAGTYNLSISSASLTASYSTASTNTTTGAVIVTGGIGVGGAGNFGSYVNVPGTSGFYLSGAKVIDMTSGSYTRILDPSSAQSFSVGNTASGYPYLFFDRNETWFRSVSLSLYAKMQSNGLNILTSTTSTSTSTGSLTTLGGVGIAGDTYIGGKVVAGTNIQAAGWFSAHVPQTSSSATVSVNSDTYTIILSNSTTITLTLPTASSNSGRILYVKNTNTGSVVSASSNVIALSGGSAATALLAAGPGKWAMLQSDGTDWIIMAAN